MIFLQKLGSFRQSTTTAQQVVSRPPRSARRAPRMAAVAAISALTLTGVVACGQSTNDTESQTQVEDAVAQTLPDLQIALEDPGAQPHQQVLFAPAGDTSPQQGDMVITQAFSQNVGDQPEVTADPAELTLPFSATTEADNAGRRVQLELGTPSGSRLELRDEIATAEGFVATFTGSRNGQWAKATYQAPQASSTGARASVENALGQWLSVPVVFPVEKIGPGARWTVTTKVNNPSPATRTLSYELVKREGERLTLSVSVDQRPSVTTLSTDSLGGAEGTQLTIIDSPTTMDSGTIEVDLTKPLPIGGAVDFTTSTIYSDDSNTTVVQNNRRAIEWTTTTA